MLVFPIKTAQNSPLDRSSAPALTVFSTVLSRTFDTYSKPLMHNIISTLFVFYALSAGALTSPKSIDGRSGGFGTHGQDADLTIYIWDGEDCLPTYQPNYNFTMSWASMQNFTSPATTFTISRSLRTTEHLDWSSDVAGPPGANRRRSESVLPGCEYFVKSTNLSPVGRDLPSMPLQGNTCTSLGSMPISVSVLSEKHAKRTDRFLFLVREFMG